MKIVLPIATRYAWAVLLALLLLDGAVACAVGFSLYRAGSNVKTIRTSGLDCVTYSPTVVGAIYIVTRCTKAGD